MSNSPQGPVSGGRGWLVPGVLALVLPVVVMAAAGAERVWLPVRHVDVLGAVRARDVEVRHLADVHLGSRWRAVAPARVEARVERHPWVRRAQVRRVWPDRVRISVQEHEVAAILLTGAHQVLVSRHGVPFLEARADHADLHVPHITGIGPDLDELHQDVGRAAVRSAVDLLLQLDQRGLIAAPAIQEISFSATRGFTVRSGRARVSFAVGHRERQLTRLEQLLSRGLALQGAMDVDLAPASVAVVRAPRAAADPASLRTPSHTTSSPPSFSVRSPP